MLHDEKYTNFESAGESCITLPTSSHFQIIFADYILAHCSYPWENLAVAKKKKTEEIFSTSF